jgi:hypothetical protein
LFFKEAHLTIHAFDGILFGLINAIIFRIFAKIWQRLIGKHPNLQKNG